MTAKMPISGSLEKRRDCLAQLPLPSTSGGSKFASEHLELEKIVSRVLGGQSRGGDNKDALSRCQYYILVVHPATGAKEAFP
jgi:hypothetical protein